MRHLMVLLFVGFIAGCGGGGDSGSNTGGGTGSGGNTGGSNTITINADNALYLAAITSLSNDALTSFAQLAVLAHDELNNKPRAFGVTRPVLCQNGTQATELIKQALAYSLVAEYEQKPKGAGIEEIVQAGSRVLEDLLN